MTRNSLAAFGLTSLAALGLAAGAHAQTISNAKSTLLSATAATPAVSVTDNPVVTEIISNTGGNSTFLIQDATGAVEVYKVANTTYTPTVGDTISVSGAMYGFHGLFEIENASSAGISIAASKTGTGVLPAPSTFTTAGLTDGSAVGQAQQSTLGTLSNVTFTGMNATGNFASGTYTVTDGTGTATVYVPSTDTGIIGTVIPTGPVNIYGYLGQFSTSSTTTFGPGAASVTGYELDPLNITLAAAPEPSSIVSMLLGVGVLGGIVARRRRVSA